jgi:outer membrane protein assembly factor BamD
LPTQHHHRLIRFLPLLLAAAVIILVAGCMKEKPQAPSGPEDEWQRAKSLFDRKRFRAAQLVLRDITLNYSGSSIIDSAAFYLARCSFELDDYVTASDEFHKLVEQYPFSKLGGDASYFESRCYWEQSPNYQLDQEYTTKALAGFQKFLEEHPQHALSDSAYHYISMCREKLARKEYSAASLYHDLGEYASAILYADVVLSNYYDTSLAGPAQFVKGRSFYDLKDWERAHKELQTYLDKYPNGKFIIRARQMLSEAAGRTASVTSAKP